MYAFAAKRWVLVATAVAALATSGVTTASAAPISVVPQHVLATQSDVTDVRYRRRYYNGGAAAAAALGLFALGASGAFGGGYDDDRYGYGYYGDPYRDPYRDPYYGSQGYYRVYRAPAYRQGYYREYRHPRHYGYSQQWRHSDRVGRN